MAPVAGMTLQKIGRKNMILLGYFVCICATVGFGLCSHLPKNCNPEPDWKNVDNVKCPDPKEDPNQSHSKVFFGVSLFVRFI
jgi:MFS family permease